MRDYLNRRKWRTNIAAMYGVKRRWLGLESDAALTRRVLAVMWGAR